MANLDDLYPSKYVKVVDLAGNTHAVVIDRLEVETMPKGEKKPVLYFTGRQKGLVLNKTNADAIAASYGKNTDSWIGKKIDLFSTRVSGPNGMTDGIRVRAVRPPEPAGATDNTLNDSIPF